MTNETAPAQRWIYYTGVVFVIFWSIVTGVFNVAVFYFFGIPLFGLLFGLILIWASQTDFQKKIVFTSLPVPIIFAAFFILVLLTRGEPEIFLIPQNLRGEITIFYDEACGQPPVYENGNRIYKIPESGILITGFKKNSGGLNQKFYLIDENERRTEIPQFHRQNFESEQSDWHRFHWTPVAEPTKDTVGVFQSYGSEAVWLSRNSFSYIIGTYRRFERDDKEEFFEAKRLIKTAGKILKQCRQS